MKIQFLYMLAVLLIAVSCSKENSEERGNYTIRTVTNSLDKPIILEIGGVTKKMTSDLDYEKNLQYKLLAQLKPQETKIIDSTFVCTDNCMTFINQRDPEMHPLFFKISVDNKTKIDTNCQHVYVTTGLIAHCQKEAKNYFNLEFWGNSKDNSGNAIREYHIDDRDLARAE